MFTEATFEVLPRLNEIKFGSGVIDELLFLDLPRECRFPSGIMMLEYGKAVQESVYEQLRVVRQGQLRIIFTQDLKILSWEFCARRHEELLPRRLVTPQVNQLLQVAQKCQSTICEGGSEGVSQEDLQTNSNMVLTGGRQLVKSLELQSLNDLGFSKRYVRCLQIAEVVNSMKDLMDFCREHKFGPIGKFYICVSDLWDFDVSIQLAGGLRNYPKHATAAKLQMQEMEQLANAQGQPTNRNTHNKLMALHPGINNPMGSSNHIAGGGASSGSAQAALALTNHWNLLCRQNSINSSPNSHHQEALSSFNNSVHSPSNFQGSVALLPGSMQSLPVSGLSSPNLAAHQPTASTNDLIKQNRPESSQDNEVLQQQMIHRLLHEMSNNNTGGQQQSLSGHNGTGSEGRNGVCFGSNAPASAVATSNVSGGVAGPAPSQSNSFKAASNSDSSATGGNNVFKRGAPDLLQNHLHFQDDIVPDIAHEFTENGFFNSDLDDEQGYGWKA
ncbi:hypothetical protein GOBAR_AA10092 [Gossypium barbadense]|uniref:Transcriptional regulator SLK2 n=1 Tax=Gossypium barbadense TaxID=3634 RepID=A0A2P5Y4T5_GOSBA|nr:hypothetical protein GOBAR_AA10092 [Gossypium barbadense]